jgi:hypothetical protein
VKVKVDGVVYLHNDPLKKVIRLACAVKTGEKLTCSKNVLAINDPALRPELVCETRKPMVTNPNAEDQTDRDSEGNELIVPAGTKVSEVKLIPWIQEKLVNNEPIPTMYTCVRNLGCSVKQGPVHCTTNAEYRYYPRIVVLDVNPCEKHIPQQIEKEAAAAATSFATNSSNEDTPIILQKCQLWDAMEVILELSAEELHSVGEQKPG